jgi:hypothetical protein
MPGLAGQKADWKTAAGPVVRCSKDLWKSVIDTALKVHAKEVAAEYRICAACCCGARTSATTSCLNLPEKVPADCIHWLCGFLFGLGGGTSIFSPKTEQRARKVMEGPI